MNSLRITITIILLLAAVAWHIIIVRLAPKLGLIKLNFRQESILASYGLAAFGYVYALIISLSIHGLARGYDALLYLSVMGAMWFLGALDDLFGTREVGGFKGHFKKLLFEQKLTTGAVKALGGGIVALAAGWIINEGDPLQALIAAVVIALAANTVNLVDLRPGRAVAVFFLGIGVTYIVAWGRIQAPLIVAAVALVTLVFAVPDRRGRAMMGDSWANAIGSALGLTIALSTGVLFQLTTIVIMVALTLYSEKRSLSALIEGRPVLMKLDKLLGVR